jgi:chitinase
VAGKDYVATSGTLTFAPGVTSQTISVGIYGDTLYENNPTFQVNLSSPTNATLARATATGTITDDVSAPTVSIGNVAVQKTATAGVSATAVFTVTLSAASGLSTTVSYATVNGTALSGKDYVATSGTLTFAPGVTSQTISVGIDGDSLYEANPTFQVNLSSPTNATLASAAATGTIKDDVSAPTLTISDASIQKSATTGVSATAVFTVTLSAASGLPTTVSYATADGTALAGSDYVATSGTLTFAPGVTTMTISVGIFGGTTNQANKAFSVNLNSPVNATLARAIAIGTIVGTPVTPPTTTPTSPNASAVDAVLSLLHH